jgi:hypothetical protein
MAGEMSNVKKETAAFMVAVLIGSLFISQRMDESLLISRHG